MRLLAVTDWRLRAALALVVFGANDSYPRRITKDEHGECVAVSEVVLLSTVFLVFTFIRIPVLVFTVISLSHTLMLVCFVLI